MHVRLIGDSKIILRSECGRVCGCVFRLSLCGPVMDWRPVQGLPRLSPDERWARLQPPHDLTNRLSGYRNWMDGWMDIINTVWHNNAVFVKVRHYSWLCSGLKYTLAYFLFFQFVPFMLKKWHESISSALLSQVYSDIDTINSFHFYLISLKFVTAQVGNNSTSKLNWGG